jgi:DNA-binding XRE family transcriptional regulator
MAEITCARPQGVPVQDGPQPADPPPRDDATIEAGVRVSLLGRWEVPLELWAHFVNYARRYRGLIQDALAEAADVSQQTISKIEAARICPHDRLKVRLAEALEVHTAALFPWPSQLVQSAAGDVAWPVLAGTRSEEARHV